jgi:hypothetical protein
LRAENRFITADSVALMIWREGGDQNTTTAMAIQTQSRGESVTMVLPDCRAKSRWHLRPGIDFAGALRRRRCRRRSEPRASHQPVRARRWSGDESTCSLPGLAPLPAAAKSAC